MFFSIDLWTSIPFGFYKFTILSVVLLLEFCRDLPRKASLAGIIYALQRSFKPKEMTTQWNYFFSSQPYSRTNKSNHLIISYIRENPPERYGLYICHLKDDSEL